MRALNNRTFRVGDYAYMNFKGKPFGPLLITEVEWMDNLLPGMGAEIITLDGQVGTVASDLLTEAEALRLLEPTFSIEDDKLRITT
jgi:hypothetical protein